MKGNQRRLNQKLNSKAPVEVVDPVVHTHVDPAKPFQCPRCLRLFKTTQGRAVHMHSCKEKEPSANAFKSKASPMDELAKANGITSKELKAYKKKLVHWIMLRKLGELRNGVNSYRRFRCYQSTENIELKARLRKAAATILPCLTGDHSSCTFSFVCKDSIDPFLKSLPHHRNVAVLPKSIQVILRESIWEVFSAMKLDALIRNSVIRTTSNVEAVHRTIRNPAPKNKPLFRNETPVLKMGAAIASCRGKGNATLRHFRALKIPISSALVSRMKRFDRATQRLSEYRKSELHKAKERLRRRRKFLTRAASMASEERNLYRKEAFDHTYAGESSKIVCLGCSCLIVWVNLLVCLFIYLSVCLHFVCLFICFVCQYLINT